MDSVVISLGGESLARQSCNSTEPTVGNAVQLPSCLLPTCPTRDRLRSIDNQRASAVLSHQRDSKPLQATARLDLRPSMQWMCSISRTSLADWFLGSLGSLLHQILLSNCFEPPTLARTRRYSLTERRPALYDSIHEELQYLIFGMICLVLPTSNNRR